jgi:hypothetical protein
MKQSLKLENEDSIQDILGGIEGGERGELIRRWKEKYGLMMKNCRRMLRRYEDLEETQVHAH